MEATEINQSEAAAELLVRHLRTLGVVHTERIDGEPVKCVARGRNIVGVIGAPDGIHFGNVADDYDLDIHLVCLSGGVNHGAVYDLLDGKMPARLPYCNMVVHGIKPGYNGHALPTHVSKPSGTALRDDIDDELRSLAEAAGLEVHDD